MPKRIYIFDTTLRDGEQSPGASLNVEEKLEIAHQLARLQVDVIEAGFPATSPGDREAVTRIAKEVKGPVIAALSRVTLDDIDKAWSCLQYAEKPRIHIVIATSPIHMQYKLQMRPEEVIEASKEAVRYAKKYTPNVEFSAEDASRSDLDFLARVITAAIDAGATVVNIPDTVGYAVPQEFREFVAGLIRKVPNIERAILSVHCHNDLGMATANSLAAVLAGAQQIECTVNGIGERAGNTALEEIVMAIYTRRDFFDMETGIKIEEIYRTSRLVSGLTGMPVQYNKAIVGRNAFQHESGIHQDGVLKERTTYEIMNPAMIGLVSNNIVLGKLSGRHAFRYRLEQLGFKLSDAELEKAFERFKNLADRKGEVTDKDLEAIVEEEMHKPFAERFELESLHISAGTQVASTATVGLKVDEVLFQEAACGEGPVDAVFKAVDKITGLAVHLENYTLSAVTGGKDALGEVTVHVRHGDRVFVGRGSSTDIIEASLKAYLSALNKIALEIDYEGPAVARAEAGRV